MKFLTILIIVYFLTACGSESQEKVMTVDYYKQNTEEQNQQVKKCRNNPGELMKTPNCINAVRASNHAGNLPTY